MKKTSSFILISSIIAVFLLPAGCDRDEAEPEITSVTDYDGNIYPVVRIFTRYWMAENLRTSRLNDGRSVKLVPDNWEWDFYYDPKRCYYGNNGDENGDVYGHLYNYYAIASKRLCPAGWHVPTSQEWSTLIGYLGGYNSAGGKLKEDGIIHWASPNTGADNSSGFKALPGGYRDGEGLYKGLGTTGYFWSDNGSSRTYEFLKLDYNNATSSFTWANQSYGASVRCVKD